MTDQPQEPWLFATGSRGGVPMLCRLRTEAPTDAERAQFPLLVLIQWDFEPDDDAMPDEATLASMAAFEDALDTGMRGGDWGRLVAVVTSGGEREWRVYTADFERFQDGINDALNGQPRLPLAFETFEDTEWQAYAEIATALVPRGQA